MRGINIHYTKTAFDTNPERLYNNNIGFRPLVIFNDIHLLLSSHIKHFGSEGLNMLGAIALTGSFWLNLYHAEIGKGVIGGCDLLAERSLTLRITCRPQYD